MLAYRLPRFLLAKHLAGGRVGFYWTVTGHYRKQGCTIPNESLGTDYFAACGPDGSGGRAAILNALFDEWRAKRAGKPVDQKLVTTGTVDWLFRKYKATKAYQQKVAPQSRPDYERVICFEWLQRPENVISGHIGRITAATTHRQRSAFSTTRQTP
jgi:hypothetical protein